MNESGNFVQILLKCHWLDLRIQKQHHVLLGLTQSCVAMLDGDSSGLKVCGLMGWGVSVGFAVALSDGAEVLVFMTVGKLHAPPGRILCLAYQCS